MYIVNHVQEKRYKTTPYQIHSGNPHHLFLEPHLTTSLKRISTHTYIRTYICIHTHIWTYPLGISPIGSTLYRFGSMATAEMMVATMTTMSCEGMGIGQGNFFVIQRFSWRRYTFTGTCTLGDLSSLLRILKMTRKTMAMTAIMTAARLIFGTFLNMAIHV